MDNEKTNKKSSDKDDLVKLDNFIKKKKDQNDALKKLIDEINAPETASKKSK